MHSFWTLEIIGDLAINISCYVLSTTSFLKLIFVAAVVLSQKELRLPNFGEIWLSTIGTFTSCFACNFLLLVLQIQLDGFSIFQVTVISCLQQGPLQYLTLYESVVLYNHIIWNSFCHFKFNCIAELGCKILSITTTKRCSYSIILKISSS